MLKDQCHNWYLQVQLTNIYTHTLKMRLIEPKRRGGNKVIFWYLKLYFKIWRTMFNFIAFIFQIKVSWC